MELVSSGGGSVPIGAIVEFPINVNPGPDWIRANGVPVPLGTYPDYDAMAQPLVAPQLGIAQVEEPMISSAAGSAEYPSAAFFNGKWYVHNYDDGYSNSDYGQLLSSVDRITWTRHWRKQITANGFRSIGINTTADKLVVIPNSASYKPEIMALDGTFSTAPDTIATSSGQTGTFYGTRYYGGKHWALGSGGIWHSADGLAWAYTAVPFIGIIYDIGYNPDADQFMLVGAAGKIAMFDTNAVTNLREVATTDTSTLYCVTYANERWTALGTSGRMVNSPDGVSVQYGVFDPGINQPGSIKWIEDLGLYMVAAVTRNLDGQSVFITSPDMETYESHILMRKDGTTRATGVSNFVVTNNTIMVTLNTATGGNVFTSVIPAVNQATHMAVPKAESSGPLLAPWLKVA